MKQIDSDVFQNQLLDTRILLAVTPSCNNSVIIEQQLFTLLSIGFDRSDTFFSSEKTAVVKLRNNCIYSNTILILKLVYLFVSRYAF